MSFEKVRTLSFEFKKLSFIEVLNGLSLHKSLTHLGLRLIHVWNNQYGMGLSLTQF